jgi:hypothetical protein
MKAMFGPTIGENGYLYVVVDKMGYSHLRMPENDIVKFQMRGKRAPQIPACVKTSQLGFKLSVNGPVLVRVGTQIMQLDFKICEKG